MSIDSKKFIKEHWVIIFIVLYLIVPYFLPTDTTDRNWFYRSGFSVYKDNLTGCQYIKRGIFSSLTPRLKADGTPMCGKEL